MMSIYTLDTTRNNDDLLKSWKERLSFEDNDTSRTKNLSYRKSINCFAAILNIKK